jgi:hypothetical protein
VDTLSGSFLGRLELLGADAPEVAMTARSIVERIDVVGHVVPRQLSVSVDLFLDPPFLQTTVALYFMYYNFARVHQTLRVTPAMEAGIADHIWSIEEIVGLLK